MTLAELKTFTPEELERMPNAVDYELEDGYLVDTAKLGPVSQLPESDTITGEDVLPGFECAVREFFDI